VSKRERRYARRALEVVVLLWRGLNFPHIRQHRPQQAGKSKEWTEAAAA
jgi:hypothetical protein